MKLPTHSSFRLAVLAGISLVTPAFAVITTTDSFGSGGNAFTMDFVTVGNPGNTADTTGSPNPAGSVAYTYRMGSYEVSRDMVSKANAGGAIGLTMVDMTLFGGNGANRPATGISWNEAARFVNFLNITSGSTVAYKFSSQPGENGYSANTTIVLWSPGDVGYDITNPFRNSNAKYFLPSENEWYKAAYYSSSGTYYNYPNGSNAYPEPVAGGAVGAVYGVFSGDRTGPADVTNAGGLSPYGTMAQGGNVSEWMESRADRIESPSGPRLVRGGMWVDRADEGYLDSSTRSGWGGTGPEFESGGIGFRVASVPEPSGLVLTTLACGMMLVRRKR